MAHVDYVSPPAPRSRKLVARMSDAALDSGCSWTSAGSASTSVRDLAAQVAARRLARARGRRRACTQGMTVGVQQWAERWRTVAPPPSARTALSAASSRTAPASAPTPLLAACARAGRRRDLRGALSATLLYRGILPPLIKMAPRDPLYFGIFENAKRMARARPPEDAPRDPRSVGGDARRPPGLTAPWKCSPRGHRSGSRSTAAARAVGDVGSVGGFAGRVSARSRRSAHCSHWARHHTWWRSARVRRSSAASGGAADSSGLQAREPP